LKPTAYSGVSDPKLEAGYRLAQHVSVQHSATSTDWMDVGNEIELPAIGWGITGASRDPIRSPIATNSVATFMRVSSKSLTQTHPPHISGFSDRRISEIR